MSDSPDGQESVLWWPAAWEGNVPIDTLLDVVPRHPVVPPDAIEQLFASPTRPAWDGWEQLLPPPQIPLVLPERMVGVIECAPVYDADDQVSVTVMAASHEWPLRHGWQALRPLVDDLGLVSWDTGLALSEADVRDLFLEEAEVSLGRRHLALPADKADIEAVLRATFTVPFPWHQSEADYVVAYAPMPMHRLTVYGADVALVVPARRLVLAASGGEPSRVGGFLGWVALVWAWLLPLAPQRTELALGSAEPSVSEALERFVTDRWPDAHRLESVDVWDAARESRAADRAPGGEGAVSDPAVVAVLERLRGVKRAVAAAALKGLTARAIYEELQGTVRLETVRRYWWEFRTQEKYKAFWPHLCPPDEDYSRWGRQAHP